MPPAITEDSARGDAGLDLELISSLAARGLGFTYRELSGSMAPALRPWDQVHVEPCAPSTLRTGDIVALQTPAGLRVHRLFAVQRGPGGLWLHTAGDALVGRDPPRPASDLLGRVTSITRAGKQRYPLAGLSAVRGRLRAWRRWSRWRAGRALRAVLRL